MRGMHVLIFQILKVFGSKSPIEPEGLSVCYPKRPYSFSLNKAENNHLGQLH